ncbi:MAG: hypothetical protein H6869_09335 [Rhodospirillales bacterium]|nr:hypothetical protein [Rhodospirillales bacterium]
MSATFNDVVKNLKAWVVFSGQVDRPWLRVLRPGFRHCFVILNDGHHWLSFDPMLNHIDLRVHGHVPPSFDLPAWLSSRGQTVVAADVDHTHKEPMPLALFTCVEAVKRILGLHRLAIQTPWQLYSFLMNNQKERVYG